MLLYVKFLCHSPWFCAKMNTFGETLWRIANYYNLLIETSCRIQRNRHTFYNSCFNMFYKNFLFILSVRGKRLSRCFGLKYTKIAYYCLFWKFCSHYFFKGRYTCRDKIHTTYSLIYNAPNDIIDRRIIN